MNKDTIRKKYKNLRAKLNQTQIDTFSLDIANQLLQLPVWEYSFYHLFLSIEKQKEINTDYILHILQGKDKNVVLSISNFEDTSLTNVLLTDTTKLVLNSWGIPEPVDGIAIPEEKIQVVFVPLLAYDLLGNRVGYGKGFYDTFLARCSSETIKIGVSFFDPENKIDDVSPRDISLDYCITPTKMYTFKV